MKDKGIPLIEIEEIKENNKDNEKIAICLPIRILKTPEFCCSLLFVLMELIFHFVRFGGTFDHLGNKILFAVFYGILFGTILSALPARAFRIVFPVFTVMISIYYSIQVIYSGVFNTYLSVSGSIGMTGQAFDYTDVIWHEIRREWWVILLMLIPFAAYMIWGRKWLQRFGSRLRDYGFRLLAACVCFLLILLLLRCGRKEVYSAYSVYKEYTSVDMSVEKLGVMETLWLDVKNGVLELCGIEHKEVQFMMEDTSERQDSETGNAETENAATTEFMQPYIGLADAVSTECADREEPEDMVDTSPNILEIDFDSLIAEEKNSNIVSIHQYVQSVTPTNKNEYTGMFEGYNLIFVVAEGFSGYVIDAERTPTLYKMSHEGFYFRNYYTPLWYGSTLGGEYADLTGLMPKNGGYLSMAKAGKNGNDMMFTLSRQLERQGYKVMGFHDNEYTYYDRHISHPNLGYEWIGMGNGLEPERNSGGTWLWPQSDLNMIEQTFDMYKDEEPFHTYYLTVSGHVMYNWGGNAMAARHKDITENLDYSDTTKAYIACQYELELALTELNEKLEEAGIADHTLIVVTADHVPYDDKDVVDELAGKELDNTFEWYKNTLIIWSASMDEPVTVNKYCSSLDILPTVSNLMGLPYDSRMLVGQDILSDSEGMVMFNDRSFITDRCSYNAGTGEIRSVDGSKIDDSYVESKIAQVKNKFSMAESICDYDYYRYIDEAVYGTDGQDE